MFEKEVNKIYSRIRIGLASPDVMLGWSFGEVLKPETINYRTLRPEKDGLFCERIFGTTKDWECFCGKFKSVRYKGVVCDRCGVEVTDQKVRRERMGHIQLACPVAHIWFYKAVPSRIGLLLDISVLALKSIIYYEKYIVMDPGDVPDLKKNDLLSEEEHYRLLEEYSGRFQVGIGAEIIYDLLKNFDLESEAMLLREKIANSKSVDKRRIVRLSLLEDFLNSSNRPEWMILTVVPIIPPELRPMVQLEGGRFATSDLNDLYRRLINRNNRLKKLIALSAPEIIIKNEKRMLQESVDALFDNSRRKRAVRGVGSRTLKSLSDILKGKQGRFRQNLLGKRVDYSARSVIVVGPELKLYQCGIPQKMALEIFKPFLIRKLVDKKLVFNIKSAKRLIDNEYPEVWSILKEVVKGHPVILNRAPTLHRLGMQAFEPVLTNEKAIRLHPLVCSAYNADFDGDQMAVHLPLSSEAQIEAWVLMLSALNLLDPANGDPIVNPSQDIVLGSYDLTLVKKGAKGEGKRFSSQNELLKAMENDVVELQAVVFIVDEKGEKQETTAGRVIFSEALPEGSPLVDKPMTDKELRDLIAYVYVAYGNYETMIMLDKIKQIGFHYSTIFANTISLEDIIIPLEKVKIVDETKEKVKKNSKDYQKGIITEEECYQKNISLWIYANDEITRHMMDCLKKDKDGHNSLNIMATSGARSSKQQIRQLAGMRGLMAKPSGEIIDMPIISNFKEGLTVLEYFISTHGARKGLSDTALKTADAGYLTRKLVDIAQDVCIVAEDCGAISGIEIYPIKTGDDILEKLSDRVVGRYTCEPISNPFNDEVILHSDKLITAEIVAKIDEFEIEKVKIRTVVTCDSPKGICQKCYGINLANGRMVNIGEAVGITASQSIGQPGTQLTMRTFHIGGTASSEVVDPFFKVTQDSIMLDLPENLIETKQGDLMASRRSFIALATIIKKYVVSDFKKVKVNDEEHLKPGQLLGVDKEGKEVKALKGGFSFFDKDEKNLYHTATPYQHALQVGAVFEVGHREFIEGGKIVYSFDAISEPMIAEISGTVRYQDVIPNKTVKEEVDEMTGVSSKRITAPSEEGLQPKLVIVPLKGDTIVADLPIGSNLIVDDGAKVTQGDILSTRIRSMQRTSDITGGLPRVQELFEARNPLNSATIAGVDGIVEMGDMKKKKRIVFVKHRCGVRVEHVLPVGQMLTVRSGDQVKSGEVISEGMTNPHDVLSVGGEIALYRFILSNVQEVYKRQGVTINDKHIEVIVRQMLRKVEVVDPGDVAYICGDLIDKFVLRKQNEEVLKEGGQPAVVRSVLLGLTKASLNTESFISSAAFQETTKVLTNAAIKNTYDELKGLKENLIIGQKVPAGTGKSEYEHVTVFKEIPGDLNYVVLDNND